MSIKILLHKLFTSNVSIGLEECFDSFEWNLSNLLFINHLLSVDYLILA